MYNNIFNFTKLLNMYTKLMYMNSTYVRKGINVVYKVCCFLATVCIVYVLFEQYFARNPPQPKTSSSGWDATTKTFLNLDIFIKK